MSNYLDIILNLLDMDDLKHLNEPSAIPAIFSDTHAAGFNMPSEPLAGALLRILAASKPSGRLLELGSGTGLSTAWILDGMNSTAHLITIDLEENLLAILNKHLGDDQRLTVICGDGDEFLQSPPRQQFDFIFADTWAGKYRLLDEALALLKPGGIYVIDDMLPQPNWPEGHDLKAAGLIATLEQRSDLRIVKMSWASGMLVAIKI